MAHAGGRPRKELNNCVYDEPTNGSYYTVTEAAELLGIHRHTLQARLRDGTIKGKKINGLWKIYKEELKAN